MLKTIGIYALLVGSVFLILGAYFSAEFLKKINLEKTEVLLNDAQFEAKNNRRDVFFDWPIEVRYITDELMNLKFSNRICSSMGFSYMFQTSGEEQVIGCQITPLSQSAVMLKPSDQGTSVEIGSLSVYAPVIKKALVEH